MKKELLLCVSTFLCLCGVWFGSGCTVRDGKQTLSRAQKISVGNALKVSGRPCLDYPGLTNMLRQCQGQSIPLSKFNVWFPETHSDNYDSQGHELMVYVKRIEEDEWWFICEMLVGGTDGEYVGHALITLDKTAGAIGGEGSHRNK